MATNMQLEARILKIGKLLNCNFLIFKIQIKDLWSSELILLVDKPVYPHIRECKNSEEIWTTLQSICEDNVLVARVGLIQIYVQPRNLSLIII